MKNVFIDSDILMDFLVKREPFFHDASKILSRCEKKQLNGYTTPVIICNIYYLIRRVEKHEKTIQKLRKLMNFLDILIIDKQDIINALESNFSDFEDALQNYAAKREQNIDVIITRNIKDYKHSSLSVMTPTEFLKSL